MKKTIPTTLAGTLFYIEEDAYQKLSEYLDSIKHHFADDADSAEIISDIENRIAEKFLEKKSKEKIVTIRDVEALMASMGNAEDFEGGEGAKSTEHTGAETTHKKLFRNPDDKMVAGVASGLAAFFGIDATIVRIAFVLVTLLGGSGVLIYIILWLVIPEANTSTEKLQMRGEKITLESVKEMAKEKINEVKDNPRAYSAFRNAIRLPFIVLGKILKAIVPIIRKLVGFFVTLGASFVILVILFVLTTIIFNVHSPYVDFPFLALGHHFLVYAVMFASFFAVFIPSLFVLFLGMRIMSRKNVLHKAAGFSLLGVWCLSLIIGGAIGVRLTPEYRDYIASSPAFEQTTEDFPVTGFTSVRVENGNNVTLTQDAQFKVSAAGVGQKLDNLSMKVEDGTLVISNTKHWWVCIFCNVGRPEISVTMPAVEGLSLANGSSLTAAGISSDDLSLTLANGSHAEMGFSAKNFTLDEANASWANLSGTADSADLKLANGSDVDATKLIAESVKIKAENGSVADVHAVKTLDVNLANGSIVTYTGSPTIQKTVKNGSQLEQKDAD